MTTTARLAHFAASLSMADVPPAVRQRAQVAIIDALGTVYAGLDEQSVRLVRAQALREAAVGRSSLLGMGMTASPGAAALANGAAAHALDFDNISLTVSGFIASRSKLPLPLKATATPCECSITSGSAWNPSAASREAVTPLRAALPT